jgi:chemotaxis protein CheX
MAIPPQLTDDIIQDTFVRALQSVFKTMISQEIAFDGRAQQVEPPGPDAKAQLIGNVGFGGKINGLVYLCMPDEFAHTIAGRMLGMDAAELSQSGNEAVTDAIGEITNMSVGGFKNALADMGFPCKLTIPTIVRGRGLSVNSIRGTTRYIFHFSSMGHRISADVHMQFD